jgi:hypothetical protein
MEEKTAVEWLAEQMMHPSIYNPYIEQAKEMEKQQIIDACEKMYSEAIDSFITEIKTEFIHENWDYLDFIKERVIEQFKNK